MPSQGQSFQADTTGQLVHIGMQAQKAETEAGPFVRVSFVLTGIHPVCYFALFICTL